MQYAEQEFGLSELQSDGRTLREHLEQVQRLTKKRPKELDEVVELPESMREYWQLFLTLNATRSSGFGASPISYTEIWCYSNLVGLDLQQHELDMIRMFDNTALEHHRKQEQKRQQQTKK